MIIWRMRISCCIPKATHTHSEYVILNVFPQQQWLHERASILRYTYIVCLVGIEAQIFLLLQSGTSCICKYNSVLSSKGQMCVSYNKVSSP
jgi:hypothetical protein